MSNGSSVALHREVNLLNQRLPGLSLQQVSKLHLTTDLNIRFTVQPNDGFWKSKRYVFLLNTAETYPHKACEVTCLSRIAHPNIYNHGGAVCLSSLEEDWSPEMRLEDYVMGILFLLHNPNFEDPLSDAFWGIPLETALKLAQNQTKIEDE